MNGILQVKAAVVSTGNEVSVDISTTGVKAKAGVDVSKWEKAPDARPFRPLIRKAEKLIAMDAEQLGDLDVLVKQLKEAVVLGNKEQAETLREELRLMVDLLEKVDERP
jgi:hypothetical protein